MIVHDLIVEHGVVEGEAESDRVASIQTLRMSVSLLVSFKCTILDLLKFVRSGRLRHISVIVSNHFLEECLRLVVRGKAQALRLDCVDNILALFEQLILNLCLVRLQSFVKLRVFRILLNGADGADRASLRTDQVLETDRKLVPLVGREVFSILCVDCLLEVVDHVLEPLCLLRNSGQKDLLLHFTLVF